MERSLMVVCGPTASGKSAIAVAVCECLGGQVVSCDSMQLYRGMDIGTAKPTPEEMRGIAHHMLDVLEPSESCSAARYRELAKPAIDTLFSRGIQPVLCGGTGLYIDALTKPLGFSIEGDESLRASLSQIPPDKLHAMLKEIDPPTAQRLHANDVRRVIRAIEVHKLTGKPLSWHMARDQAMRPADYPARLFAPDWPREALYARIDQRVDEMIGQGLVDEVRRLLDAGVPGAATAMQAIGYKEIIQALRGECGMDEATRNLKQATRNYAKRQLTWFRRDKRVRWIPAQGRTAEQIALQIIEERSEG